MATATLIDVGNPSTAISILSGFTSSEGEGGFPLLAATIPQNTWSNLNSVLLTPGTYCVVGIFLSTIAINEMPGAINLSLSFANASSSDASSPTIQYATTDYGVLVSSIIKVSANTTVYFNMEQTGVSQGLYCAGLISATRIQ
jgi:hypothetical protein